MHYSKIEPLRDKSQIRRKLNINEEFIVISAFGHIHETKRIIPILKSFNNLSKKHDNILLFLVGEPSISIKDEMDQLIKSYSPLQISLLSAVFEPHWLHRYREIIDWKAACLYNPYLTDDFLIALLKYVEFDALGQNLWCEVSEEFIETYMNRFNHSKPVPLIIRHLTEQLYLNHKDTLKVDSDLLYQYHQSVGDEEYEKIQSLLEE